MDHIDKLALQQHHDDLQAQAEQTAKLIKAMEALNSKEININLPENLRINQSGITQIEGEVKAIVANALEISNLEDLTKHLTDVHDAIVAGNEEAAKRAKANNEVLPKEVSKLAEQFSEAITILKEFTAKDFGVSKVANQVVVFPKQARDAMPVRLVLSNKDKFYDALFSPSFSAPDNVRINNSEADPVKVEIVAGGGGGGSMTNYALEAGGNLEAILTALTSGIPVTISTPLGIFDASDNRINPATEETVQAISDALDNLSTAQGQEDELAILEEIQSAIQAIAQAKGIVGDLRVTIVGGAVTITSGTITTVTTVAALTNLVNIGGFSAQPVVYGAANQTAIQSNINNVIVS